MGLSVCNSLKCLTLLNSKFPFGGLKWKVYLRLSVSPSARALANCEKYGCAVFGEKFLLGAHTKGAVQRRRVMDYVCCMKSALNVLFKGKRSPQHAFPIQVWDHREKTAPFKGSRRLIRQNPGISVSRLRMWAFVNQTFHVTYFFAYSCFLLSWFNLPPTFTPRNRK